MLMEEFEKYISVNDVFYIRNCKNGFKMKKEKNIIITEKLNIKMNILIIIKWIWKIYQ